MILNADGSTVTADTLDKMMKDAGISYSLGGSSSTATSATKKVTAATATAPAAPAAGAVAPADNVYHQGDSVTGMLNKYVMQDPNNMPTIPGMISQSDINATNDIFQQQSKAIADTASKLDAANESFLQGKLPQDVADQIRQNTSESALRFGIGTQQAGAALTARDLGLTSLQVKQQGISQQAQIAGVHESAAKLAEMHSEFSNTFNQNQEQWMNQVRQLNLQGAALEQDRQQFNAKQNTQILGFMAQLVGQQQQIAYQYSYGNMSPTNSTKTFDSWLKELQGTLG